MSLISDIVLDSIEHLGALLGDIVIKVGDTLKMAKEKLFPKTSADDKREPHERFADFAARVVTVPKTEIDEREKKWHKQRKKRPK